MNELIFQITFESDVVLPASSNTEGNIEQLEFIAGSNFLGMVAKKYLDFEDAFNVFHSGEVRFGDASLLVDNELYYKMPFSLFNVKLDENEIYHHHFLTENKGQLKQIRKGYISACTEDGLKIENIEYNYAQKSAYDSTSRRSKDSSMYGYKSIKAGTQWQFIVKYTDNISEEDLTLLKSTLLSSKRLGKSKSSQYGAVSIVEQGTNSHVTYASQENGQVILYANSRLALVDEQGNPTYDLKHLCEGLESENIVYEACQIRTSSFTPYNGAMQTKTYERLIIEKGSVIVLKDLTQTQMNMLQQGVGVYLAEGFGELLLNPSFLMQKNVMRLAEKKPASPKKDSRAVIVKTFSEHSVQFLVNRHNESLETLALATEVQTFIAANSATYTKKMNSQWGAIRSLCATQNDETIKDAVDAYISKGVAKEKWAGSKKTKLLTAIESSKSALKFTTLLSMQMLKQKEFKDD